MVLRTIKKIGRGRQGAALHPKIQMLKYDGCNLINYSYLCVHYKTKYKMLNNKTYQSALNAKTVIRAVIAGEMNCMKG
jgi:hypothetical protein